MELDRKVPIRSLYPVTPAYPRYLGGKGLLVGARADVLNYRITKDDVECRISKRQPPAVPCHESEVIVGRRKGRWEIQDRESWMNGR